MLPPSTAARARLQRRPDFGSPVMYQAWRDLLFLHWPVPTELVQRTLPDGLFVDTFVGEAYLSVVPFRMKNIHPRGLPTVPYFSSSLELNFRTYVFNGAGIPGVWFYSLDADNPLLVALARMRYGLPYFKATLNYEPVASGNTLFSARRKGTPENKSTLIEFRTGSVPLLPESNSLEFFLLERYLFFGYKEKSSTITHGRIHHKPYLIHEAELIQCDLGVLNDHNFGIEDPPVAAHFSPGVDVEVFGRIESAIGNEQSSKNLTLDGCPESAFVGEFPH